MGLCPRLPPQSGWCPRLIEHSRGRNVFRWSYLWESESSPAVVLFLIVSIATLEFVLWFSVWTCKVELEMLQSNVSGEGLIDPEGHDTGAFYFLCGGLTLHVGTVPHLDVNPVDMVFLVVSFFGLGLCLLIFLSGVLVAILL